MAEISLPWGGSITGDAGPYTDDQWTDVWRQLFTRDRTLEGVLPDYLNELVVTNPAGLTIRVASGGAVVDGKFYRNTANVDFAGAAPGGGSNFYTVVAHKDFAAQTVRLSMLGPNAVAPPAVTQADGVDWEIAIYEIEITSGSVVTLTDVRVYCHFNTNVSTAMLEDGAVTTPKLPDGAVTAVKLTDGAGSGVDADLLDGLEGSAYLTPMTSLAATADIVLAVGASVLIPGMTGNFDAGTYLVFAEVPMIVAGAAGTHADINLQCFLDAVLQAGEGDWQDDIAASGRSQKTSISFVWRVIVVGVQTIQIRASITAGDTAVVTTIWQIDKAYALKV